MSVSPEQIDLNIDANSEALADIVQAAADQVDDAIRENHTSLGRVIRAAKKQIGDGIKKNMQLLGSVMEPVVNGIDSAIAENAGLLTIATTDTWYVYCDESGAGHYSLAGSGVDQGGLPIESTWSVLGTFASIEEAKRLAATCNTAPGVNGNGSVSPSPSTSGGGRWCLYSGGEGCRVVGSDAFGTPLETIWLQRVENPLSGEVTEHGCWPTRDEAIAAGRIVCGFSGQEPPVAPPAPPSPPPPATGCICVDVRLPKEILALAKCLCDWLKRDTDDGGNGGPGLVCETEGSLYSGM